MNSSITSSLASEQQANAVALQAQNQLSRITTAMQSMQNMQTAARNLAIAAPSTVPDGLQSGGLVPDSGLAAAGTANPVKTWTGASTPTQTTAAGKTTVTINQTAAQALLSWNSFNVSKSTTVNFNQQGNTSWTALNKIAASGSPSQILGSITASGHVYLIDPNGIIFGGASQVNVGSLVASSADLSSSQYFANGIFSTQSGAAASSPYTPSFTNAQGAILVQPGAQITTNMPADVTTGGGVVLLLGTQVLNGGTITTSSGQTELAAGDNFIVRPGYGTDSNTTSTTRGDEVAIELNQDGSSLTAGGSGLVENNGMISADTGDITLAGETVAQNGVAVSTTSVAIRGTIHLLSSASDASSSVTLGSNAYTLIEPDLSSADTELDTQRSALIANSVTANAARAGQFNPQFDDLSSLDDEQDESRIEIVTGGAAHFTDGSDSSAPGGQLAVSATQRVQVDDGALLDVSGSTDVAMAMSSNDIAVNIQNNELRDDPQNRLTGDLNNNTVYVDDRTLSVVPASSADTNEREYSAGGLLEVSGYVANVGHTIGEYTAIAGSIDLSTGSKGAIIAQSGSDFDINGGTLQYQSGNLQQSYLMGSDGRIYNVNNAPSDITYTGVYDGFSVDHSAWSVTQTYADVLNAPSEIYEAGYVVGRAAGSLTLSSPTTIFNGAISAAALNGPTQTAADPSGVTDPYLLTQSQVAQAGTLNIETISNEAVSAIDSDVTFEAAATKTPDSGDKVKARDKGDTLLDTQTLDQSGLGTIQVVTDGSIAVTAPITVAAGGTVNLYGANVDIGANITAPGGSVAAGQVVTLPATAITQAGTQMTLGIAKKNNSLDTGNTTVESDVAISTAGLWSNLMLDPGITFAQAYINGGSIDLGSAGTLKLENGSVIDSAAGGAVTATGAVKGGAGGNITLAAATEGPNLPTTTGNLILRGTLDAVGYTKGGALTLAAPSFEITNASAVAGDNAVVTLNPAFFSQGFSAYNLQSTGDIKVAPNTIVNITEPTYQVTAATMLAPTGAAPAAAFTTALEPIYTPNSSETAITQRPGASFTADIVSPNAQSATSVINNIALNISHGAKINVDPGQSINLQATGQITIEGSLSAPGGTISAVSDFNTNAALADGPGTTSIWIGADATLDASARTVSFENAAGSRISIAPSGGTITLGSDSSTASIIIRQGAVIEASGSAATDIVAASAIPGIVGSAAQPTGTAILVEGAGGAITLASEEGIYNDGTLTAAAGGADAAGGSLGISLEADQVVNANEAEATPRVFTITQDEPGPQLAAGLTPGTSTGLTIGTASISAQAISQGGFGSVTLFTEDAFLFNGNVTLSAPQSISLEEGYYADTSASGSVALNAPYVLLSGSTPDTVDNGIPLAVISGFSAQTATGTFTVNAATIGINNAVRFGGLLPADGATAAADLAGFGTINLNSSGDLQFVAPLDYGGSGAADDAFVTTGNLNLSAREIYAVGAGSGASVTSGATTALIVAGYSPTATTANGQFNPDGVLNISSAAGSVASAPDTIGGGLTFAAATINQGGAILQPLGSVKLGDIVQNIVDNFSVDGDPSGTVNFLPGSITSVSAAGLNIPFGGTTDGVNYDVLNQPLSAVVSSLGLDSVSNGTGTGTITIQALATNIESGASIDLAGGGALTGAGFISGEGGSTDVLTAPLLNVSSSGVTQPSLATDPVYAIVAGVQPTKAVAYTESGSGASQPALGEQIVIPAGVPGLAAGTYTLLPASYALEPGGYRVEFDGAAALSAASVTALTNGSYAIAGYTALAGTNVRGTLADNLTITPAASVLNYAQYDQESYSAFLEANAVTLGELRPVLPEDAGTLVLNIPVSSQVSLTNQGLVSLAAASGGIGGTLQISGNNSNGAEPALDIYGATPTTGLAAGTVSLSAAQIDAFDPFTLEIGAAGAGNHADVDSISLENGATLTAARVVLTALTGGITLNSGSVITTVGQGTLLADSTTEGQLNNRGASVLDVGNGYLTYNTAASSTPDYGPITVADGAAILTDGSIAFSTSAAVSIGVDATYGGKYLDLAVPEINVGDPQALGATAPAGLQLTQSIIQTLTQGIPADGVPAVQILDLTASDSLNFYGTTSLDLTGANVQLVINTPAIYGFGGTSDVATIGASTIVWNGIAVNDPTTNLITSGLPGGTVLNGPGSGSGTLVLNAQNIIFGYSNLDVPQNGVTLTRLAAGFSTVDMNASSEITANNEGSLSVYQAVPNYQQAGTGGTLNVSTPLLTAADGATIGFTAGNDINIASAAGVSDASNLATEAAGGEIDLTGQNIGIGSSVILPSGRLNLQAQDDISLGSGALISLAGLTTTNVDQIIYGFGGDLIMASAAGNITQAAGSVIDVSAVNNTAGSVSITADSAGAGQVALNGTLLGSTSGALSGSDTSGVFTISAQSLGDFAALNSNLDAGGFFQTRNFNIQQGNLTIGDGVRAHQVTVSLNNGSLTVTGLIDASGNGGGSIDLAASGNLTLATSADLDAHGTVLQTDSYGEPIASENAPLVSLTTSAGTLTLDSGATIDLASAVGNQLVLGDLELNAPRMGTSAASATDGQTITDPLDGSLTTGVTGPANAQSDDVAIAASGPLNITGASTIALNGFATYANAPSDPNDAKGQVIDQAYLDLVDQDSQAFVTAATANAALQARIAGLTAYGSSFSLRPGVQIESATADGDIAVNGDIDLAGYRYGPGAIASDYGAGAPGALTIRAGGNLNVYGSITDGFEQPASDASTEFSSGWVVFSSEPYEQNQTIPVAIAIEAGSSLSDGTTVNYAVPITGGTLAAGAVVPVPLTLSAPQTMTVGFVATSNIIDASGNVIYAQGTVVPAGTVIPEGATIAAGGTLPVAVSVGAVIWPANTPFTVTTQIASGGAGVQLASDFTLPAGALIPGGSTLLFQQTSKTYLATRANTNGTQGQLYGLASLLPAGDQSWSINLVSGADTAAASPDATQTASTLSASAATGGSAGDLTLADTHYGIQGTSVVPAYSVIRTGTGSLSLVAGGSIDESSAFGVYTAGTPSAPVANEALYDQPQGDGAGSTLLGPKNTALAALVANYAANYPTDGGNVLVSAQGDLNGFISVTATPDFAFKSVDITDTDAVGEWLWQQGGDGDPAAWWIEYGALDLTGSQGIANKPYVVQYTGFQGIGTLGGGNLTVNAGGNATGLDLVVASNGRVNADGTLAQYGGGALNVKIGGAINAVAAGAQNLANAQDAGGIIADMRGDTSVDAASIGAIFPEYGTAAVGDPRFLSPLASETAVFGDGIDLAPGDGTVTVDARGNLAIGSAVDPGTVQNYTNTVAVEAPLNGVQTASNGVTDFSLWTGATSIDLFSAGGDVVPAESAGSTADQNDTGQNLYPATLLATAQNGNIYFGTQAVELSPSTNGQLQLLAADSIIGDSSIVSISGAALSMLATPFDPGISALNAAGAVFYTNHNTEATIEPIDFGADTPTDALHADDTQPARVYAASGDILDIEFGQLTPSTQTEVQLVRAAKPLDIFAGRDIVDSGTSIAGNADDFTATVAPDVFLNLSTNDISSVTAGRDIIESSFDIAGPGELAVQAGRNYDAYADGVIDSIGPVFDIDPTNRDSGAEVSLLAGVGTGPDYTGFENEFLNPGSTLGLQDASDIISTNDASLYAWLQENYAYTGTSAGAYTYFQSLSSNEQDVFLRQLYFTELNDSGLEFNDASSVRYKSYVLGKTAIAALFPTAGAKGQTITYNGGITMYGGSGIHTDFGGNIETLTPGGETLVGVEGTTPPASAGIITQGNGNIDMYALNSVELGESRVLTTFGGNIVIWSAQGDINAGRGSKTTIDYTPLQRIYDNYGDVYLSPSVPSSGAGIATLNPIPSVPAGNIDLIAPLGTVDAGEAGIRGSGDLNIAALHVLNAANIQVQGATTGVPTAVAPNIGALSSSSNAAGAAAQAAESSTGQTQAAPLPSIWIVEILGYGGDGSTQSQPQGGSAKKQGGRSRAL